MKIVQLNRRPEWFDGYPDLLTPSDVAEITRQSAKTARKLMRTGQIPKAFKIGPRLYVTKTDFANFVERAANGAA